ncbi:hypothetical protein [Agrobacterium tumefaciens]|uniref:hypothetical protein n=1 Tax=Agrobacterium tumefaciens TaxID=358 RepID=UPI0022441477|nr:hypothetical protein [Agrobacterium tumefaciens]MCW8057498.1 hypothetical protein [Agrobacterium tumefaciens]MCW8146779.1 hypothetical protein [Agrobacterium tumefaciens]
MRNRIIPAVLICAASLTAAHAAEFDINGMKLGMNGDQVVARYQELRPDGQYSFSRWKLPEGSEWVANGRTLYNDLGNPDDMEHERLNFAFTGLGSGNKLFAVRRELKFRPSQRPSTESVYAAAVQKYGKPSVMGKSDTSIWAAWKFSSVEAPAEKLESPLSCIGTSDFPVGLDDHTAGIAKKGAAFCGLYIEFTVRGDQTGLANELDMGMMNHLDLVRDFDADNQDARKRIDAAKAKNTGSAAPAPQL